MMHVARLLALWYTEESRIGIVVVMIIFLDWCSVLLSLLHLVILLNYFLCLSCIVCMHMRVWTCRHAIC